MTNLEQMFIAISAIAGSTALWKFAETRITLKAKQKKEREENSDSSLYRMDLMKRVEEMSHELEEARQQILELTKEVAELRTENKFLQKEIEILKSK